MKIQIRAFARFGELFGKELRLSVPEETTINEALHLLCSGSDEKYHALFNEEGAVHEYIILVKNRTRVERAEILSSLLEDGDEMALLPPVAGG